MKPLLVIGASRFAVEVGRYIEESLAASGTPRPIAGWLAFEDEPVATSPDRTQAFAGPPADAEVVVAVSDPAARQRLFAAHGASLQAAAVNIVHPSATVASGTITGRGNIIGPYCYFGINAAIGHFNVFNYQIGVGHHSTFGDRNFVSPGFQCGNSVTVGNGNFIGLGCVVGPGVRIGDDNRLQAGTKVTEGIADGLFCYPSDKLRMIRIAGESKDG